MRLYRILGAGWAGTQADAKAAAKTANAPWHEFEVPTDKLGLLAFLNDRNVPAQADEVTKLESARIPLAPDPMDAPTIAVPAAAPPAKFTPWSAAAVHTRDSICEAIGDAGAVDLGFFAMEVAARFEAITKAVRA